MLQLREMARYAPLALFFALLSLWSSTILYAFASPYLPLPTQFSGRVQTRPVSQAGSVKRTDEPQFPDTPPSCPICAENYWNINSCAEAAPVLQNFSMVSVELRCDCAGQLHWGRWDRHCAWDDGAKVDWRICRRSSSTPVRSSASSSAHARTHSRAVSLVVYLDC